MSMAPPQMMRSLVDTAGGLTGRLHLGYMGQIRKGGALSTQGMTHTHVGATFGHVLYCQDPTPVVLSQNLQNVNKVRKT